VDIGFGRVELLRREFLQRTKPSRGCKCSRLTYAFKRSANILLEIGKQRGIGRIEALTQNVTG